MMKVQLHEMNLDGKPLDETGEIITGKDVMEIVENMKRQSPFTFDQMASEYMKNMLVKLGGAAAEPLPDDGGAAAAEFLSRLGSHGMITFLPDGEVTETPTENGGGPCADKPGGEPPRANCASNSACATEAGNPETE